jgi:hypothetical protein
MAMIVVVVFHSFEEADAYKCWARKNTSINTVILISASRVPHGFRLVPIESCNAPTISSISTGMYSVDPRSRIAPSLIHATAQTTAINEIIMTIPPHAQGSTAPNASGAARSNATSDRRSTR